MNVIQEVISTCPGVSGPHNRRASHMLGTADVKINFNLCVSVGSIGPGTCHCGWHRGAGLPRFGQYPLQVAKHCDSAGRGGWYRTCIGLQTAPLLPNPAVRRPPEVRLQRSGAYNASRFVRQELGAWIHGGDGTSTNPQSPLGLLPRAEMLQAQATLLAFVAGGLKFSCTRWHSGFIIKIR